jgi:hypothetical protein
MCVSLLGPRALIGRSAPWQPMSRDAWETLAFRWRTTLGAFDEVAGYQRTDASRGGVALLLLDQDRPVAFVKLQPGQSPAIEAEARATDLAWRGAPATFRVPGLLDAGDVGGWSFCAVEALPPRIHRMPADPPLRQIGRDLDRVLGGVPRPSGTPAHWRPMHGDFTPWNLRELDRGVFYLIDWEHVAWGPPSADEVLYRATAIALGRTPAGQLDGAGEAIEFWRSRIAPRPGDARDKRLDRAILRALDAMPAS